MLAFNAAHHTLLYVYAHRSLVHFIHDSSEKFTTVKSEKKLKAIANSVGIIIAKKFSTLQRFWKG